MKKNYKNATGVNTLIIITVDFDARRRYRYAAIYSIVMIGMTMYRRNKLLLLYKKKQNKFLTQWFLFHRINRSFDSIYKSNKV